MQPAATPLRVEGTLRHPANGASLEYSVVLAIRNERGEEIARQVVGVGALQPGDARTFSLAVEVFKPAEVRESKPQPADAGQRAAADSRSPEVRAPGRPGLPPPRPATLADGKPAGARPSGAASPPSPPSKWPATAPSTGTTGRYPAAPSTGTTGRYPAGTAPAPAPGKTPPAASPPPAPSRMAPAQPLRSPQAPALSGGGAAPSRGVGPGVHPKR